MLTYFRRLRLSSSKGFTLVELLVVSLIIVFITAFILFRQQGFNSATLLRSLAYSVALSVRQAQVYGISVREQTGASGIGTGTFVQGYGVYFSNTGCLNLGNPQSYQLFADSNGDGQRTNVAEDLPCYRIGNGKGTDFKVKDFCAHVISPASTVCYAALNIGWMSVYFRRPNPDACIATSVSATACQTASTPPVYDYAYVQLQSQGGIDIRTIKMTTTGQITVCKLNADPTAC